MSQPRYQMPPVGVALWRCKVHHGYYRLTWTDPVTKKHKTIAEHAYIWQLANGPIPSGYCIHHIDNDHSNNELCNLELISIKRHSSIHNTVHGRCTNENKRVYAAEYRKSNKEKVREWNRAWSLANPEKRREACRKYRDSGKRQLWRQKRRAMGLSV